MLTIFSFSDSYSKRLWLCMDVDHKLLMKFRLYLYLSVNVFSNILVTMWPMGAWHHVTDDHATCDHLVSHSFITLTGLLLWNIHTKFSKKSSEKGIICICLFFYHATRPLGPFVLLVFRWNQLCLELFRIFGDKLAIVF